MKAVILGAAGRTGEYLVRQALNAGHEVTAFVRDAGKLANSEHLTVHVGDARNVEDLAAALKGQDVVVSALGSNKPGDDLIVATTKALIEAMHKTGVKRVIMMSSFLASPQFQPGKIRKVVNWAMRPLVKDKQSGEDILRKSGLDWTIVYATRLDGAKPGKYRVLDPGQTVTLNDAIARADVAKFLLKLPGDKSSIQKSLVITAA